MYIYSTYRGSFHRACSLPARALHLDLDSRRQFQSILADLDCISWVWLDSSSPADCASVWYVKALSVCLQMDHTADQRSLSLCYVAGLSQQLAFRPTKGTFVAHHWTDGTCLHRRHYPTRYNERCCPICRYLLDGAQFETLLCEDLI